VRSSTVWYASSGSVKDIEINAAYHQYPEQVKGDRAEVVQRVQRLAEWRIEYFFQAQQQIL
jgi:hypothetical protein